MIQFPEEISSMSGVFRLKIQRNPRQNNIVSQLGESVSSCEFGSTPASAADLSASESPEDIEHRQTHLGKHESKSFMTHSWNSVISLPLPVSRSARSSSAGLEISEGTPFSSRVKMWRNGSDCISGRHRREIGIPKMAALTATVRKICA